MNLNPEQLHELENWLLDEGLPYADAVQRLEERGWGKHTVDAVGRIKRKAQQERRLDRLKLSIQEAEELEEVPVDLSALRNAVLKLACDAVIDSSLTAAPSLSQLLELARVLQAERENDIKERWVLLAQAKHESEMERRIAAARLETKSLIVANLDTLLSLKGTPREQIKAVRVIIQGGRVGPFCIASKKDQEAVLALNPEERELPDLDAEPPELESLDRALDGQQKLRTDIERLGPPTDKRLSDLEMTPPEDGSFPLTPDKPSSNLDGELPPIESAQKSAQIV